jgi:hypothetical protein
MIQIIPVIIVSEVSTNAQWVPKIQSFSDWLTDEVIGYLKEIS